jgi:RNA ligase
MITVEALGFSMEDLYAAVLAGDVRRQVHPEFDDLYIYNYVEDVQFRNKWNKITLACRGLIVNQQTGELVARPWKKFFNFGQRDNEIDFYAPVEVTDKMDGSLGILYQETGDYKKWCIATRGSFASDQAEHATEVLATRYYDDLAFTQEATFLFEIVYPANRIVVNYGDMDDLVLLGAVDKRYGFYHGPQAAAGMLNWQGPVTEVFNFDNFGDALSNWPQRKGKEGVVIRSGDKMVKLKQAEYVELHRIVTNLSPKTIWQMLGDGKTVDDICREIPDEFHEYVKKIGYDLIARAGDIQYQATLDFGNVLMKIGAPSYPASPIPSRRAFAAEATKRDNPSLLFNLLDDRPIDDVVWKMVKPRGDVKSLVEDEG